MVHVYVLANRWDCQQVGHQPYYPDCAVDVRLLLDVLVIPGCHTETHLLDLVSSRELSSRVVLEALIDVHPS